MRLRVLRSGSITDSFWNKTDDINVKYEVITVQENPLVSIVVPIYNMAEMLKKSMKYILAQTYKNIEIILIDDGSNDNTYGVCCEFAKLDGRVHCIRQENMGSGPARNRGIEIARGKYIYFADADDEMDVRLIECAVCAMEQNNCDMAVFGFKRILSNGTVRTVRKLENQVFSGEQVRQEYDKFYENNKPAGIQGAPWNKMFRLDCVKKHKLEYPAMRRHQDEVFIMRYVDIMERVVFIDEVLYIHSTNNRQMIFKKFPKEYFDIVSELNSYRMKYIIGWNSENKKMLNMICEAFVYYTGNALMYSFNPRYEYSLADRYDAVKEISRRFVKEMPDKSYNSGSTMFKLMKRAHYIVLYFTAYLGLRKYYKK